MRLSREVSCVISGARIASNYDWTKVCFAYFGFYPGNPSG
jgi:hypothetical protein